MQDASFIAGHDQLTRISGMIDPHCRLADTTIFTNKASLLIKTLQSLPANRNPANMSGPADVHVYVNRCLELVDTSRISFLAMTNLHRSFIHNQQTVLLNEGRWTIVGSSVNTKIPYKSKRKGKHHNVRYVNPFKNLSDRTLKKKTNNKEEEIDCL